jgi:hypothetical protein
MRRLIIEETVRLFGLHYIGPILVVQGNLHQGFGVSRLGWSGPSSFIIAEVFRVYLTSRCQFLLSIRVHKSDPHLVLRFVYISVFVSPRCKAESIDLDLCSSDRGTRLGRVRGDERLNVVLESILLVSLMKDNILCELLTIESYCDYNGIGDFNSWALHIDHCIISLIERLGLISSKSHSFVTGSFLVKSFS